MMNTNQAVEILIEHPFHLFLFCFAPLFLGAILVVSMLCLFSKSYRDSFARIFRGFFKK